MPTKEEPLVVDESARLSRHEQVKGAVEAKVQDEIREKAEARTEDHGRVGAVAGQLRAKALTQVEETEAELHRSRSMARVSQFFDYLFYVVYGLIGLEVALELLGARQSSGFKRFLDTLTSPLLAPFKGVLPDPSVGPFQLMMSYVVAFAVYVLLHLALNGLLRLFVQRKTSV
jgi:uncharacterized protein YggT (Ycf19 family)